MPDSTAASVLERPGAQPLATSGGSVVPRQEPTPARLEARGPIALLPSVTATVGARRWRRSPMLAGFCLAVLLPTVLAGLYYGLFASYSYVSEFRATVRSIEPVKATGVTALLGLAGPSQSNNDANAVVQYLESRDALEEIDRKVGLRAGYESSAIDWLSRMSGADSIESFQRYWRRHLDAYFETTTGTIVVRVTAFTPQMALAAADAALTFSEGLVNRLSTRAHNDSVTFAEKQLADAEQRLTAANLRLRAVQDQERILDPQKSASSTLALSAKLREQLTTLNATMAVQRNYMTADSPVIKIMQEQIDGVQREIAKLDAATTGAGQAGAAKPLSGILGTFDMVESDRGFAEKNYQSALAALEAARLEASRQQVYLATIVRPELPQEASYPKPLYNTASVFGIALLIYGIGLLSVLAVKEHV